MLNKKYLFEQAFEVEDLLKVYVEVHNRCLKEAGSFWSLFKNTDFSDLLNSAKAISRKFDNKHTELNSFKQRNYELLHSVEKQFFNSLLEYVLALTDTNHKLVELYDALYLRSVNKEGLSWLKYRSLGKKYEEARKNYLSIGEKLQKHYRSLDVDFGVDNYSIKQNFSIQDLFQMSFEEAKKYQEKINEMIFKVSREDMAKFKFVKASD